MTDAEAGQAVHLCSRDVSEVELQHGTDRVRHVHLRFRDGAERNCVLRRAPRRELLLYRHLLDPDLTGAPALLGAADAGTPGEVWLLLEGLPERHPDFAGPADVAAAFRHLGTVHRRFAGRPLLPAAAAGSPWVIPPTEVAWVFSAHPALAPHAQAAAHLLGGDSQTLVQGDYHGGNLLLETGRVRVLDWEHAALAQPVWDLVMLAPDEPGWPGMPRGALAELALQTYHAAGPLGHLPWEEFLRLHTLARLFVAARWALVHHAKAVAMGPGGPQEQVLAHARAELDRVAALAASL